jgi:hypothetical protein
MNQVFAGGSALPRADAGGDRLRPRLIRAESFTGFLLARNIEALTLGQYEVFGDAGLEEPTPGFDPVVLTASQMTAFGTKQTCQRRRSMSVVGGRAENICS